jgi:hypothetical protein
MPRNKTELRLAEMPTNRAYPPLGDTGWNGGHPILDGMAVAEGRHERK